MRARFTVLPHDAHLSQSFLLRLIPHAAGIDQDGISIMLARSQRIAALRKCLSDLLRITFVHLSPVSFDKDLWHRPEVSVIGGDLNPEIPQLLYSSLGMLDVGHPL